MHHRLICSGLFLVSSAFAQHLSVGIKGGVPLTGGFSDTTVRGVDLITRTFSDSKQYIIGPMVELRLPFGLGVEADALYHSLNLATENQLAPQNVFRSAENITSWEFPVLGKFRLSFPLVKPYVEAGPSFRHVGSNRGYLSGRGFTIGGGIEVSIIKVRIAPELRYTRWGSDAAPTPGQGFLAPSQVNQAAFLVGFSF